jgi:hypothetical protein
VAVRRLFDGPMKLDLTGVRQQSICYDGANWWMVSWRRGIGRRGLTCRGGEAADGDPTRGGGEGTYNAQHVEEERRWMVA